MSDPQDIKAWRKLSRATRRSAWAQANATRSVGAPPYRWFPTPELSPLQAHVLSGRATPGSMRTLEVSLGFNRAQRRAMKAKSGPAAPTAWGRTAQPYRLDKFGLMRMRAEAVAERFVAMRDANRPLARWWRFLVYTVHTLGRMFRRLTPWWSR